jgi:hypothetical protein
MRRHTLGFAVAVLVSTMLGFADIVAVHATRPPATPTISGPIRATAAPGDPSHDYPFHASLVDLPSEGYVEEEFLVAGTANRYNTPPQATGTIIDGNHPYKTVITVRRPASARRFNGTVVVEWNNVTAGRDQDIDWFQLHDHLVRAGYAWIGVTAQRIGVDALKEWSPKRYAALDVTHGATVENDALSYDIFAGVAQAVRHPGTSNVMGGLKVDRIFATGHSQSAGRLATYLNSIHPLTPAFDAVIVHGGGGRIRTDLDIKVWKLLAETDVIGSQAANRQPDTAKFRTWEVAGSSHVDLQFVTYSRKLNARDGAVAVGSAPVSGTATTVNQCERTPWSHVQFHYVMSAALDHLVRWVKDGTPPPGAPPIDTASPGPPAAVQRDKYGNALGGIRLAEHAVPTGVNTGVNSGPGFCRLYGSHEDFDAATLTTLYQSHEAYVSAVKDVTQKNVKAGYLLKADADATIADAEKSNIGKR